MAYLGIVSVRFAKTKWQVSEQHGEERDADHGQKGGPEGALRHHRLVLAVFQTEHGAERCHGHTHQHGVDARHGGVDAGKSAQIEHTHGHEQQADGAERVGAHGAHHAAHGDAGNARADDQKGGGHGHAAQQREWLADECRRLPSQCHDDDADVGGEHGRLVEQSPVELARLGASDKEHAPDEDGDGVGHVEDAGIEHRTAAEDGSDDGVADEPHVGVGYHETVHASVFAPYGHEAGQERRHDDEEYVGEGADGEQRKDKAAVGHGVAHGRRDDEAGARHLYHEVGQLAVEVAAHEFAFVRDESCDHDDEEHDHLRGDSFYVHILYVAKRLQSYSFLSFGGSLVRIFLCAVHVMTYCTSMRMFN